MCKNDKAKKRACRQQDRTKRREEELQNGKK